MKFHLYFTVKIYFPFLLHIMHINIPAAEPVHKKPQYITECEILRLILSLPVQLFSRTRSLDDSYSDNAVNCVDLALYCRRNIACNVEHCISKILLGSVYHVLDVDALVSYC